MASDLTFTERVAVAELAVTIVAVLLVLPYLLVAFGFFPESGFARRVHPSDDDILEELRNLNTALVDIRQRIETQTNAVVNIGENLN
jgi:hypothetical protein